MELTPEQEKTILDAWNKNKDKPPSLKELTQLAFSGDFDGRSEQGRLIKLFLSKRNLRAKAAHDPDNIEITLTDEQQLYITNNASTMNALEMTRILFNNPGLTNLHAQTRAVNAFMKTLDTTTVFNAENLTEVPEGSYDPPKTLEKVFRKVNSYVNYVLDKDKLTAAQKKNLMTLINYLHTYRFVQQMNSFEQESDRKLCEDAFIRATYDKPDLAQEEIDQYIEYANQVVQGVRVLRRSNNLQQMLETIAGNDPETMKISMGLVEAIGKASTEYHQTKKREQDLLDTLKEKRSARLSKQIKDNASILNLVDAWKQEESRLEYIKHAELEQQVIDKEIDRLTSLSELKARILGVSRDELRY